jgi:hypothetical protein
MRQLIIDLDNDTDHKKETQVLQFLSSLGCHYHTSETQSIEEYNQEIADAEEEIERGNFTTAEDLKKEARSW